uniref:C-type lectin domain-containing protein n=1 Tax=Poecilia mexicana TaxID=48701 RepID=A0A3B3XQR4_9TELE
MKTNYEQQISKSCPKFSFRVRSGHLVCTSLMFSTGQSLESLLLMSAVKPPPTPSPGDGKCLSFFVPYGQYCYFMYDGAEGFSWNDARHYCQSVRTELTSIHSRAEIDAIPTLVWTFSTSMSYQKHLPCI